MCLYLPRSLLTKRYPGHNPSKGNWTFLSPTCALGDVGRSRSLSRRASRAPCALAVDGATATVVTDWALQHRQETTTGAWVEGVGRIVGAVDHTKTSQDVAIGDDPLLGGVVGSSAAGRALLAGFAAALGGVEAGRAARSTCRGGGRHSKVGAVCQQGTYHVLHKRLQHNSMLTQD
jgi:hypothetical protein